MCRLFGFRSAVRSHAHRSLVAAHNALAEQALAHPHGWGIGYFHGEEAFLLKDQAAAAESAAFRRAADRLATNALVAHVRRATVGEVASRNTHPFRNGRWLFAHNGTIHGFAALEERLAAATPGSLWSRRLGDTDSEAFFYLLLGALDREGVDVEGARPTDVAAVAAAASRALERVRELAAQAGADAPVVNFLLTNGKVFVAQRHGRELHFSTQKRHCPDAESCLAPVKSCLFAARTSDQVNHLLVASERIGEDDIWEDVPEGTMIALDEGFGLRRFATG